MMNTSKILLLNAIVLATLCNMAAADDTKREGYLLDSRRDIVRDSSGLCVRTGSWTPEMVIAECDSTLTKKVVPAIPVVGDSPPTITSPIAPVTARHIVYKPYTLQTETLFAYNKAEISSEGKQQIIDGIIGMMKKNSNDGDVQITGHADRIGSKEYNLALSQRRADTVASYLVEQGIDGKRIVTVAKGESEPVVSCDKIKGRANHLNLKLIRCLQPNRRIVLSLKGQSVVGQ
jgi:OOP family OmpA-OmpF porin